VAWARAELDRLGLEGWVVDAAGSPSAEKPCSAISAEAQGTVVVAPSEAPDELMAASEIDPVVEALREGVAEQCVTVDEARAIADEAYSNLDFEPFPTTVVDEELECATADLQVGGSMQVTVYGPTTVG
jgi:hypothetical protein